MVDLENFLKQNESANGIRDPLAVVRLALKETVRYTLPPSIESIAKLAMDYVAFRTIEQAEATRGDLVLFGVEQFRPEFNGSPHLPNADQHPVKNAGVVIDEREGELQIIHASQTDGLAAIWPLGRFASDERTAKIYGFRRLKPNYGDDFRVLYGNWWFDEPQIDKPLTTD